MRNIKRLIAFGLVLGYFMNYAMRFCLEIFTFLQSMTCENVLGANFYIEHVFVCDFTSFCKAMKFAYFTISQGLEIFSKVVLWYLKKCVLIIPPPPPPPPSSFFLIRTWDRQSYSFALLNFLWHRLKESESLSLYMALQIGMMFRKFSQSVR